MPRSVAWTPFALDRQVTLAGRAAEVWSNTRYVVVKRDLRSCGEGLLLAHLSIHDHAKTARHDWRELQRIKNELVGPEAEAVELYPAESRLTDTTNEWHLWVFAPGFRLPFGFPERIVAEGPYSTGARQRPFEDPPPDLITGPALATLDREVATQVQSALKPEGFRGASRRFPTQAP